MFGSDWPVCQLAGSYGQVYEALTQCITSLSENEQAQVMGQAAIGFYGLEV